MSATKIWLIRHGTPDLAVRGVCYGRLDVGLAAEGRRQLTLLSERLRSEPLAAIYSSPRKRTIESAAILAAHHRCRVQTVEDLREINFGDFEGLSYAEIEQRYPELYRHWMDRPTEVEFPNGESFARMCARVMAALTVLRDRHAGQSVAIVTHGGVTRIVLADALGVPAANVFRIAQRYAALNLIHYVGAYPVVKLVNGSGGFY
jgi:alpha-ribazole phosphatase/probable phosphoglycerate mutase